jgi:hypothetical protein
MNITFTEAAKPFILGAFGMSVDADGFICKDDVRVLNAHGEIVHIDRFIGIHKVNGTPTVIAQSELFEIADEIDNGSEEK